jgi:tRNA A-37 threonylcarbamoyl transferase component Bud32
MSFNVGESVGPYRILEQLGQGGMATVFKAYHAALDRYVAIKVLHPAFLEDKNFLARFQREARLVAKLDHPNIVPIYDYAEHEGRPYLVMKFIEGETLKSRLMRGSVPPEDIMRIVAAVGTALAYAHKQGILHRDIKPSNVILAGDGSIYLADFGLARIAQSGESTLTSDMIIGTPQYISPEQAIGRRDLDEGTDIYSFGVMLYEMTVGQVPFSADTPFSIIHDHIYTPLPLPTSVNPSLSPEVERVLLKALAKDRADRYTDVTSLVEAFRSAWQHAAPSPKPLPTGDTTTVQPVVPTVPVKKKRAPWMWIATAVLLCVCCGFVSLALRGRNGVRPLSAVQTTAPAGVTPRSEVQTGEPNPALQGARDAVSQNPDDPQSHLDLAVALWDARNPGASLDEVNKVIALTGQDQGLLIDAAHRLSDQQNWAGASLVYMHLAGGMKNTGDKMPPELMDGMHESLYKAAEFDGLPRQMNIDAIGEFDQALMHLVQARYSMLHDQPDGAIKQFDQYLVLKKPIPEGQLLDAEMKMQNGDEVGAKQLLDQLLRLPDLPMWIKESATRLRNKIP